MHKYLLTYAIAALLLAGCTANIDKDATLNPATANKPKIIAYVTDWKDNWGAHYEKAKQVTHINYAFANIIDGKVVEGNESDEENIKKLNGLKEVNPELKILISIGGWTWSDNFSDAVLTEKSRLVFANSAINFLQKHNLDGLDLDWEYPGQRGEDNVFRPEDKENFTAILKQLRKKLDSISSTNKKYLLTIASGANQNYLDHTNMAEAHKHLDFINIMTYDFHGIGSSKTGHHANLNISAFDSNSNKRNATTAVQEHINAGIPAEKIVLGVPFYGKWWKGAIPINNGCYQESSGDRGYYSYSEIADSLFSDNGFISYWDSTANAVYIWRQKDSLFVTYDNAQSIEKKAAFVKENHLGGVMFWQYNADNGTLLEAINANLK